MLVGFKTKITWRDWYALLFPVLSQAIAPFGMILCLLNMSEIICTAAIVPLECSATVLLSASTSFPPKTQIMFMTLLSVSVCRPRHRPKPVSLGGFCSFLQTSIDSSHVLGGLTLAASRRSRRVTSGQGLTDCGTAHALP